MFLNHSVSSFITYHQTYIYNYIIKLYNYNMYIYIIHYIYHILSHFLVIISFKPRQPWSRTAVASPWKVVRWSWRTMAWRLPWISCICIRYVCIYSHIPVHHAFSIYFYIIYTYIHGIWYIYMIYTIYKMVMCMWIMNMYNLSERTYYLNTNNHKATT